MAGVTGFVCVLGTGGGGIMGADGLTVGMEVGCWNEPIGGGVFATGGGTGAEIGAGTGANEPTGGGAATGTGAGAAICPISGTTLATGAMLVI